MPYLISEREWMDGKNKFLAEIIADLGKILVGAGGINQIFSNSRNWKEIWVVVITSTILFIVAFFIHPSEED